MDIWGVDALLFMPPQTVDIAIIKATTAKFSVVPKEKHVRSECRAALRNFCRPAYSMYSNSAATTLGQVLTCCSCSAPQR